MSTRLEFFRLTPGHAPVLLSKPGNDKSSEVFAARPHVIRAEFEDEWDAQALTVTAAFNAFAGTGVAPIDMASVVADGLLLREMVELMLPHRNDSWTVAEDILQGLIEAQDPQDVVTYIGCIRAAIEQLKGIKS